VNDKLDALERLAKLKAEGSLTEQEYQVQKDRLMAEGPNVPALRRLWLVVLLTCLIITFPIALIILVSGPVFKKGENGPEPISNGARWTYAGFLGLWLLAVLAKAIVHPGDWETVPPTVQTASTVSTAPASLLPPAGAAGPANMASPAPAPSPAPDTRQQAAGNQDQTPGSSNDPLASRYSPEFKQCMASGDAANGSTSAMLACTNDEIRVQDRQLNETYRATMMALSPERRDQLRDAERFWIKQRDAQCPEGDTEKEGQMALLFRPACLLSQTITQTMTIAKIQAQSGNGRQ
jgi:uncharacterized protein YecT (DUF1311 family)